MPSCSPTPDTSFLASRASVLDHAALTLIRPVVVQRLAVFLVREVNCEQFASRTFVGILVCVRHCSANSHYNIVLRPVLFAPFHDPYAIMAARPQVEGSAKLDLSLFRVRTKWTSSFISGADAALPQRARLGPFELLLSDGCCSWCCFQLILAGNYQSCDFGARLLQDQVYGSQLSSVASSFECKTPSNSCSDVIITPQIEDAHRRTMRAFNDKSLTERLQTSKQAKQELLQKFKTRPGPDDPIVKARRAERQEIAAARKARAQEKEAAKQRAEQERAELEALAKAEQEAARERELQEHIAREAEQKAIRDARYAARKKRKK